jgi:agmatinase
MTAPAATTAPLRAFLDWPIETEPAHWQADVALLGILHSEPYPGDPQPNDQSRAPDAIRWQSRRFCYASGNWDFDLGSDLDSVLPQRRIDAGNVGWTGGSFDDYSAAVTARLRHLWSSGTQVVILGGDHGITIPALDALDAVGEPVHVLQIDAHIDWREEVRGVRRGYSSPMRWASTKNAVAGITQIGIRAIGSARRAELAAAEAYGAHILTAERLHAQGMDNIETVLATIPEGRAVYLTIDADGIDPAEMPGVMAPTPGGLRFQQLAPLLRRLARRHRIVGIDLVEIAPALDLSNGITCVTAGRLLLNILGASWAPGGAWRQARDD